MTEQHDLPLTSPDHPLIDRYTVGLPDAPEQDPERWDPFGGGRGSWQPGDPQPEGGTWQRTALQPAETDR